MNNHKNISEFNVVLVDPEIPQNTGNVGRTCVGLGWALHLVGKLGFSLDSAQLKRAGLDYWPRLNLHRHETWELFLRETQPQASFYFFSTHGVTSLWEVSFQRPCYLVFGAESHGLPKSFYDSYQERLVRIPINDQIRSLNLATAVGVAAFEVARQHNKGTL